MRMIWSDCGRQGTEYPANMCVPKITQDQHRQRWPNTFSLMSFRPGRTLQRTRLTIRPSDPASRRHTSPANTSANSAGRETCGQCPPGSSIADYSKWGGGTEQAVAALEQKWLQGQQTNNPDLIAPLLADKIVDTSSDGKVVDKAGALAMAKAMKYSSAEYYDVKVTAFGNTAIASGGFKGKGTDASGKPFNANERWTDTWMKMLDGKWQCIATQATPVKM
jgi:ketosteroid isomerase-like protein